MLWVRLFVCLLSVVVGCGVAPAQNSGPPKRVALVIGESDYLSVPQLANPASDAEQIGAALRDVGFTKVMVAKNLAHVQFLRALRDFAAEATDADWAVIYYAGHGIEVGGKNYMIPTDAELATDTDVEFEAISMDAILASVAGATKLRLVILDACRDNPFFGKMRRSVVTRSLAHGLARVEPQGDLFVVYSAQAGATALDGPDGESPFVKALLRNIRTPGLEVDLLFRRVRAEVMRETRSAQEPAFEGEPAERRNVFQFGVTTAVIAPSVPRAPERATPPDTAAASPTAETAVRSSAPPPATISAAAPAAATPAAPVLPAAPAPPPACETHCRRDARDEAERV